MIGSENFNPQLNRQKLLHGCIHPHVFAAAGSG
jgi:hypothetical protein